MKGIEAKEGKERQHSCLLAYSQLSLRRWLDDDDDGNCLGDNKNNAKPPVNFVTFI